MDRAYQTPGRLPAGGVHGLRRPHSLDRSAGADSALPLVAVPRSTETQDLSPERCPRFAAFLASVEGVRMHIVAQIDDVQSATDLRAMASRTCATAQSAGLSGRARVRAAGAQASEAEGAHIGRLLRF
jgi:hypothetical protein